MKSNHRLTAKGSHRKWFSILVSGIGITLGFGNTTRGQTVGGHVLCINGAPVPGVAVIATQGAQHLTNVTDSSGHYIITANPGNTYAVAPVKSGYTFSPPSTNVTFSIFGSQNFTADFSTPATTPTASFVLDSDPGQFVDATTELVDGFSNPDGADTIVYFQYGLTTSYGSVTPTTDVGSGLAAVAMSNVLSGLTRGANYHVQVVASNRFGQIVGNDATFATPSGVPAATTLPATSVTGRSVTLNGSAIPNGENATAWFEWGTTTNYGNITAPQSLGNGTTSVGFTQALTGVAAATYHFHAVAATVFGTNFGADASFTMPIFTDIAAGLPGFYNPNFVGAGVAWGDANNDGRLDILGSGMDEAFNFVNQIWLTTSNGFSSVFPSLPNNVDHPVAWGNFSHQEHLDPIFGPKIFDNFGSGFVAYNTPDSLPTGSGTLEVGDYNNDGGMDVLLANFTGDPLWQLETNGFADDLLTGPTGQPMRWPHTFNCVIGGDYNNDGYLDVFLAGAVGIGNVVTSQLYQNTGNNFTNVATGLPGVYFGSAAWGDYDNDGRLDILLTGATGVDSNGIPTNLIAQVWRNTGNGFSNINAGLPGVCLGSVAWGDYDNDGRLDILLTGATGVDSNGIPTNFITQVWRNTGNGFSNINAGLPGLCYDSVAWGDYDNDGRLDILLNGATAVNTSGNGVNLITQIWHNNTALSNTPPTAPTGLKATASGGSVIFSWTPTVDAQTPSAGLTYNVRAGLTPGGSELITPMAESSGRRLVPKFGNAQEARIKILVNPPIGTPIYWSVQAIDTAFAGSPFATEQSFGFNTVVTPTNNVQIPGDTNGDGIVDQNELAAVLSHLNGNGIVTQSELDLVLSNFFPFSPFLTITNVAGLGGTNISFALTNSVAGSFSVQYSTNLTDWFDLGPATPRYEFTDTNAPGIPQRYYRLRYP